MTQIEKNKAELWKDIHELANAPLSSARGVPTGGLYGNL